MKDEGPSDSQIALTSRDRRRAWDGAGGGLLACSAWLQAIYPKKKEKRARMLRKGDSINIGFVKGEPDCGEGRGERWKPSESAALGGDDLLGVQTGRG